MRPKPMGMTNRPRPARPCRRAWVLAVGALAALAGGCSSSKPEPSTPSTPRDVSTPEYLRDTVGEITRFAGREPLAVQGHGFVTGLDGTGTTAVPPGIRRRILEMMQRNKVTDAERILNDPDTAVVSVFGRVPPGARVGEPFDLGVRVIPGTETTSLEGGFLLECDLHRVRVARGVEARSKPLALGRGSIFVSPFTDDDAGPGPRSGRILAGGRSLKDRQFRLVLLTPSVRTADQLVRLLNGRFPEAATGTADPARVDLTVPEAFRHDKTRFLDLVGALYMRERAGVREQRIRLLISTLRRHEDMDRVALCLEAFGASVAPHLHPLGDSDDPALRFYAGRTLAHLQDARAVHVLEPIVSDDASPFQEEAVEALGRLRSGLGLGLLSRSLQAASTRVRVAAWRMMSRLAPGTFLARRFEGQFDLHVVATEADPFVYVARTGEPEIVIFGEVPICPPVLAETRRLTATVRSGEKQVCLIARRRGEDIYRKADPTVRAVIETVAAPVVRDEDDAERTDKPAEEDLGLGLGYSDVVGLLHELDQKGALGGPIVLQPLQYRVLGPDRSLRPIRPAGRDEDPTRLQPEEP